MIFAATVAYTPKPSKYIHRDRQYITYVHAANAIDAGVKAQKDIEDSSAYWSQTYESARIVVLTLMTDEQVVHQLNNPPEC